MKRVLVAKLLLDNSNFSRNITTSHMFKIIYVKCGSALWEINKKVYKIKENDVILLNNVEERIFKQITSDCKLELYIIEFEPRFLFTYGALSLFADRPNNFCPVFNFDNDEIIKLANDIISEYESANPFYHDIISAKTINILSLIARYSGNESIIKISPQMDLVLDYIEENLNQDIKLETLSKIACMSYWAFSKCFSKFNGINVSQYIMRKRIDYSIYLLENTTDNILDIALKCGFNNASNFYKAFKKITMSSPNRYR